jgi:hypothetical protein
MAHLLGPRATEVTSPPPPGLESPSTSRPRNVPGIWDEITRRTYQRHPQVPEPLTWRSSSCSSSAGDSLPSLLSRPRPPRRLRNLSPPAPARPPSPLHASNSPPPSARRNPDEVRPAALPIRSRARIPCRHPGRKLRCGGIPWPRRSLVGAGTRGEIADPRWRVLATATGSVSGSISCPCPRYRGVSRDYDLRGFQLGCDPVILIGEVVVFFLPHGILLQSEGEVGGWCGVMWSSKLLCAAVVGPDPLLPGLLQLGDVLIWIAIRRVCNGGLRSTACLCPAQVLRSRHTQSAKGP